MEESVNSQFYLSHSFKNLFNGFFHNANHRSGSYFINFYKIIGYVLFLSAENMVYYLLSVQNTPVATALRPDAPEMSGTTMVNRKEGHRVEV